MEEKDEQPQQIDPEEEKKREIDLNALFPGKGFDLNRLLRGHFCEGPGRKISFYQFPV